MRRLATLSRDEAPLEREPRFTRQCQIVGTDEAGSYLCTATFGHGGKVHVSHGTVQCTIWPTVSN